MERPGDRSFVSDDGTVTSSEAGTEGGTTAAPGINGSRARLPYNLDPAHTPVLGSWRSGVQVPALLRSAWYRLPRADQRGKGRCWWCPPRAGSTPAKSQVQWATDDEAASGHPGGSIRTRRRRRGTGVAQPAGAAVRDPDTTPPRFAWSPTTTTWRRSTGSPSPRRGSRSCARCRTWSARTDPVLLDWLVGLAFPCQRPFGHQNGVDEAPKWRILPDRFGAEANSPVMDNNGGGPLGVTELLVRATTVPTYLKDDWSRDWGALQRLTPYYPNAEPARLELGTATRSGLWNPAPLRRG